MGLGTKSMPSEARQWVETLPTKESAKQTLDALLLALLGLIVTRI